MFRFEKLFRARSPVLSLMLLASLISACDEHPPVDLATPDGLLVRAYEIIQKGDALALRNVLGQDARRRFGSRQALRILQGMLKGYTPVPGKPRLASRKAVRDPNHSPLLDYEVHQFSVDVAGKKNGASHPILNVGVQCIRFPEREPRKYAVCSINRIVPAACEHWSSVKSAVATLEKAVAGRDDELLKTILPLPRNDGFAPYPSGEDLVHDVGDRRALDFEEVDSMDEPFPDGTVTVTVDLYGRSPPGDARDPISHKMELSCLYSPTDVCSAECRFATPGTQE